MLNQAQQLSIAYIVLYALLAQPTLFVWIKHGRPGFLGWYLLLAFCLVRIIGPALSLTNPTSMPAMILSGVGLSPLMIAIIGIMHESNHYIAGKKLWYLGLGPYINIHLGIGAASALIVVGKINLGLAVLVKVGVALIAATWVVFAVYGYLSYLEPKEDDGAYGLLLATLQTLPLLLVRVVYLTVGTFLPGSVNLTTGPIAVRVICGMLPELLITIRLVMAGISARHLGQLAKEERKFEKAAKNRRYTKEFIGGQGGFVWKTKGEGMEGKV